MIKEESCLNDKQQECMHTEGKYLVIAGPGTGKTTTLTYRIESILKKGIPAEKILCLTFTDTGANEMKLKLEKKLDKLSSGVNIYTYHGFCYDLIENNKEDFEIPDNFKVITPSISRALIKECIEQINPKAYRTDRNDPYFYIDIILNGILEIKKNRLKKDEYFNNLKNNLDWEPKLNSLYEEKDEKIKNGKNLSPSFLDKISNEEKRIAKARELWDFYELYSEKMIKNSYVDFDDMINQVLEKFESHPNFLEKVANQYEYILVDEYQDTNKSQNEIIFSLCKALKSQNIFVVGDDDQIIYTFQGAKLDTIEKFLEEFPDTTVICLTDNHRSTQEILDVSRALTKFDSNRLEDNPKFKKYNISKDLIAQNIELPKNKVRCYKYVDTMQEYNEIVKEIEELVFSDKCPIDKLTKEKKYSEIAILTRSNAELETFAQMLKERNIPYELKEGKSIFTIKSSIVLYYYMQLLVNPELNSDKIFKYLLSKPFNINAKDYEVLYNEKSKNKSFIDTIRNIEPSKFLEPQKIEKFITTFDYLNEYKNNESLKNVVLEIGAKTGIFDYYLNSPINKTENIAGLKKIIDEADGFTQVYKAISLEDFVEYLDIALRDDISIKTDKAPVCLNAVQLSTYYSAKGKEYEYVYMPTLLSNKWESDSKSFRAKIPLAQYKTEEELKQEKISDRVNVMYVGMTRARHTLRLSYVQNENGKAKKPSALITNIQDMLEKEPQPFEFNVDSYWQEVSSSIIKREYDYAKEFSDLISEIIKTKNFSPTSLNKYLKCPRQYFYGDILNLDSPSGNADAMHYGTAIHEACDYAVKYALRNKTYPTKEEYINKFIETLNNLPLSEYSQRQILNERGQKALDSFYHQLCDISPSSYQGAEETIQLEIEGIPFKGKIDRIDKNEDGTFTIIDYKTGGAKSAKIICPEGEHEDYYNQIGFYKYLYEKYTGNKVSKTTFIFPEDYTKNLIIEFSENECNDIYKKYKQAVADIRSHKFEPTDDKKACQWCAFKDFCNMEII